MKVYLQREGGEFSNINYLTAWLGFKEFGYETEFFCWDQIGQLNLARETIVTGGIPAVVKCLERLGFSVPDLPSIPPELAEYAGRRCHFATLGEVRERISNEEASPVFVKPIPRDRKLFNGTVVRRFRDLLPTAALPPETPVWCSDLVQFVSEYRVFVHQREVIGCKHYKGDFRVFPNFGVVDSAVAAFSTQPAAYGIDFGVTTSGETLLVEVNDGYALGCYGLGETRYARMIETRWRELVGLDAGDF